MKPIVTLTLNPSIDSACQIDQILPFNKIRTSDERYDPGGGGINVARVVRELGGDSLAVFLAGGLTGEALTRMVADLDLPHRPVGIAGNTRVSHVVFERSTGREYRFTPSGPPVTPAELDACFAVLDELDYDYLVASGSLSPGSPEDVYARLSDRVRAQGAKLVADTSGPALLSALGAGVFLVKPSIGELETAVGRSLREPGQVEVAARELVDSGRCEMVTVTLGPGGAVLATNDDLVALPSPQVEVKSTVGAGDSFVAAMTLGLAQGREPRDAFALAVATGAATVMTLGTQLCARDDVERLYAQLSAEHRPT